MAKIRSQEKASKPKAKSVNFAPQKKEEKFKMPMLNSTVTLACIAVAAWFGYKGYLETRVNTPYDTQKLVVASGLDVPDRYWGTYRSNVYFGLKTRDPHSLVTGIMWYFPHLLRQDGSGFRHWCEQGDRLDRYGWLEHDGRTFGVQEIVDNSAILTTSFVKRPGGKHGGDWTARIAVKSTKKKQEGEEISLLFYTAIEESTKGWIKATLGDEKRLTAVEGNTQGLGSFAISLTLISGTAEEHSFLATAASGLNVLKETVLQNLRIATQKGSSKKHIVLAGEQLPITAEGKRRDANFVVTQVTGRIPFEIEISFESGSFTSRPDKLTGSNYERALQKQRELFDEKFQNVFNLSPKMPEESIAVAKMALSNMLGSIGYFYGSSQVQSEYTKGPVPYWKAPLYTAVPSRSFFPRGFLWDEGFHGLLISAWDLDIEFDIINHWFDLMNVEGWIPREMILGQEALAKVPEEFVTQVNTNANPPTFFLTLQFILKHHREKLADRHIRFLDKLYPRLQSWFNWYNTTQTGDLPGTYRWRGRDALTTRELNPKTLTSGLDDYPRASHPNIDERHVDLRCWITFAANVMAQIGDLLQRPGDKYQETYRYLSDNDLLNKLHWSPNTQSYSDFGLHTDKVALRRPTPPSRSQSQQSQEMVRIVLEDPSLRYVDSSFGYVSLFPYILQIIDPASPQLNKVLDDLKNPDLLWTNYGLRSLAKTSPLYMKYNTEHDGPYWRGPIWMNLNYLAVRATHYYSVTEGPYQKKAESIYHSLRGNILKNIIREYQKSGYIWENYGDVHGEGKGSHPFTGWTSLFVLLMAELY